MKLTKKDRILTVLKDKGITELTQVCPRTHKLYSKMYRQLWGSESANYDVTIDVVEYILDQFRDISADYIVRGEGPVERTKIVTPPTHRQDIHIAQGATAAITQTGSASLPDTPARAEEEHTPAPASALASAPASALASAPASALASAPASASTPAHASTPADIARMIKDSDLTGLIAVILEQQSTISSIKDSTIALQSTIISLQQTIADLQHELVHTQSAYINNPSNLCPISKLSNKKGSQSPD